jgi:hypothetical protein
MRWAFFHASSSFGYVARIVSIAAIVIVGAAACRSREQRSGSEEATKRKVGDLDAGAQLKIWVTKDGQIEVNGAPSDLQTVSQELAELSRAHGTVLYGRDDAQGEPAPIAMEVIKLVGQNRLPIRMSTKRDFSDAVVFRPGK